MTEQLIINGERWRRRTAGRSTSSIRRPATCSRRSRRRRRRTSTARSQSAHAAFEGKAWGGIAPAERGRIMQRIAQALRDQAEELADPREPRQRQTAEAGAHRRAGGGALLRVLRRHRRQDHGQHDPARPGLSRLHDSRADRRVGADRAVELSDSDRRARRRAGARGRMHGRAEAVERSADDGAAPRRDRADVRPAARRAQRRARHRERRPAWRSRAIRTSIS